MENIKNFKPGELEAHVVSHRDYWSGFDDDAIYTRQLYASDVHKMLRYPAVRTAIKMVYLPILAATPKITANNERTKNILEHWFKRYYRKIATMMMWQAIGWGFSVGEKVMRPVQIDGKTYLLPKGIITPQPFKTHYTYSDETAEIVGFQFGDVKIEKERTALYIYQGDEICKPKGTSLCYDVYWAWVQLMEDWSRWSIYKDFKAIPPFILKYPAEKVTEGGSTYDKNRVIAEEKLKNLRTGYGITIPRYWDKESGTLLDLWLLEEIKVTEKTTAFVDSINKLESLIFIGAVVPKKVIEQDMKVGSFALVKEQAEFFYTVEEARMREWNEYLTRWIIDPMLEYNTGKIEGGIELWWGDEMIPFFLELIKQGAALGLANIDWNAIAKETGVPMLEPTKQEPVTTEPVIEHGHFKGKTVETYQTTKTRAEEKRKRQKIAEKWVKEIDKEVQRIEVVVYNNLETELRKQQGKVGLRIEKLYNQGAIPKDVDIQKAVQIPRSTYTGIMPYLLLCWTAGMKPVMAKAKHKPMEKPTKWGTNELRKLAVEWQGTDRISGEGELLERKLYTNLMEISDPKQAFTQTVNIFSKYIEDQLPHKLIDLLHSATQVGTWDAIKEGNRRHLKEQAETK